MQNFISFCEIQQYNAYLERSFCKRWSMLDIFLKHLSRYKSRLVFKQCSKESEPFHIR